MKPLRILTSAMLFSTLLTTPGIAAEYGVKVYEPLPQSGADSPMLTGDQEPAAIGNQGSTAVGDEEPVAIEAQTNVPQAQIDYRNKRLDARMRRDEMLQMRAATIEQEKADEQQDQQ